MAKSRRKVHHRCPCCEQPVPDPIGFRPKVHLGAMQYRLFHALRRAPDGLRCAELIDILYAQDRNGGPLHNIIAVMARQINRKIEPMGLRIKGTGGPGSVYRLLQVQL
jgi:hypothetical protein